MENEKKVGREILLKRLRIATCRHRTTLHLGKAAARLPHSKRSARFEARKHGKQKAAPIEILLVGGYSERAPKRRRTTPAEAQ